MDEDMTELANKLNAEMTRAVRPVTIIVGIEVVFGFFGNLLVIYVFLMHYKVCTFKYFVLCLAVVDITCCMTTMPGEIVTQLYWYVYPVREVCKIKSFFNVFTVSAEALCLFTIAVDRYRKVCRPFGWQIKPRVAKYLCGILFILALVMALPTPFLWGLRSQEKIYKNNSITVTLCEKDGKFEKTNYPIGYISTVMTIIIFLLILMFIQYVFVAMKLLKERRNRMGSGMPIVNSSLNRSVQQTSLSTPARGHNNGTSDTVAESTVCNAMNGEISISTNEDSEIQENEKGRRDFQNHNTEGGREHRIKGKTLTKRVRRKTLIMFILTLAFIVTTVLYFILITIIASPKDFLQYMTDSQKAAYFFFLRFYFINHVINPVVYGLLDPQFKCAMGTLKTSILNKFK